MTTGPDAEGSHGVGPHPGPWPDDPRLDPELLAHGDRRNVVDRYRYWTVEAIVADLDARRHPFHVAIENWRHDMNIGTVVRNANAFGAAAVHIVGRRRWNRRGAMVTERYQHVEHHPTIDDLVDMGRRRGPAARRDRQPARRRSRSRPSPCPPGACSCSARRAPACRPRPAPPAARCARSPCSDRPARSTPGWRRASPCTRGSASTLCPDGRVCWLPNASVSWVPLVSVRSGRGGRAATRAGGER